ncbi:MAG: SDR family NAD(P)-dependent oxidoreductase [Salinarimonas sp.]|nr:SDR family NAD(P)-dependent oxidoreductase [Salinarimonas sp.]
MESRAANDSLGPDPQSAPVVIVAGASRGVGRGIALALGEAGMRVVVTGRSSEAGRITEARHETIEDTARAIIAAGGSAYPYACDHTDARDVGGLTAWCLRRFGRIDAAICAVWGGNEGFDGERYDDGSRWGDPYWRRPLNRFAPAMETGLYAALVLAHAVTPAMVAARSGVIGFVTFDPDSGYLGDLTYDIAKASVARLAYACAQELAETGVTSLALAPGRVRTERALEAGMGADEGESPLYLGRGIAAMLQRDEATRFAGSVVHAADLAARYGIDDIDGSRPGRFEP